MRVVLDTNVVVAAVLKASGISARVLALAQAGTAVTLLYDERIMAEYREVLARKGLDAARIDLLLDSLCAVGERIAPIPCRRHHQIPTTRCSWK